MLQKILLFLKSYANLNIPLSFSPIIESNLVVGNVRAFVDSIFSVR